MSEPQSYSRNGFTKQRHQFKWQVVIATVITLVVIEFAFVVTGWMWMQYLARFGNGIPVGVALATSVLAIVILFCFRSLTKEAVGLAAAAIAAITLFNFFVVDVIKHV